MARGRRSQQKVALRFVMFGAGSLRRDPPSGSCAIIINRATNAFLTGAGRHTLLGGRPPRLGFGKSSQRMRLPGHAESADTVCRSVLMSDVLPHAHLEK